jgi:uncharacterized membrane protein (DUF106 family)
MEHPLINDIDHLTLDELQSKISELQKKLSFAQRSGNVQLSAQIRMAIETFTNRYQSKMQAIQDEQRKNSPDHSDKINIS